jgi:hypothetical protein
MKKSIFFLVGVAALLSAVFLQKGNRSKVSLSETENVKEQAPKKFKSSSAQANATQESQENLEIPSGVNPEQKSASQILNSSKAKLETDSKKMLSYTIDNGVAVFQGDMVLGEVSALGPDDSSAGQAPEPQIRTWPTNEIPFFIQADLPNQDRVLEALRMFSGTRIRFVPYVSQTDAIVFEKKDGVCKSYVGYIGGLQKIYLSDKCGATEVAHEIMHSLGFVHEQNRSDRDQFIQVFWDNIDPQERINFEKFSGFAMKASGASSFDFESIMIYPDTMFSQNNNLTMKPIFDGQKINPSDVLSAKDIERLNRIY